MASYRVSEMFEDKYQFEANIFHLSGYRPEFYWDGISSIDQLDMLDIDGDDLVEQLLFQRYLPVQALQIPPPPIFYLRYQNKYSYGYGSDAVAMATIKALHFHELFRLADLPPHPAMYAENPIEEARDTWELPYNSPYMEVLLKIYWLNGAIVEPDILLKEKILKDNVGSNNESQALELLALGDEMGLREGLAHYRGFRTRPAYFGTPFTSAKALSTTVLTNVANIMTNFVSVQHKHLGEVLLPHAFSGYYAFIQDFSPLEQQIWLDRGADFFNKVLDGLLHFQQHYPFSKIRQFDKTTVQYNLLSNLYNLVFKHKESYPHTPLIELAKADYVSIEDALLDFPTNKQAYLFQVMRTQPAGVMFLQDLLCTLIETLRFVHPYVIALGNQYYSPWRPEIAQEAINKWDYSTFIRYYIDRMVQMTNTEIETLITEEVPADLSGHPKEQEYRQIEAIGNGIIRHRTWYKDNGENNRDTIRDLFAPGR